MINLFKSTPQVRRLTVMVEDRAMPLLISWRGNARRMTLRVNEGRGLSVTAPPSIPDSEIIHFIEEKSDWILARLAEHRQRVAEFYEDQPTILYRGVKTKVLLHSSSSSCKNSVNYDGADIVLTMLESSRIHPADFLEKWLRQQCESEIRLNLAEILPLLGEESAPFSIRDQKTRWGSCSSSGRLSFNWRLVMAPSSVLRYVVAHEVAHLRHHDHSAHFWRLVGELMPNHAPDRAWLRQNGSSLMVRIDERLAGLAPN